ncbi:uncharacterized protein LOC121200005 [Toxotes jaculatrix]|uniref:uncharacterized protein LOC121200005 n=1 Tax=Toxotes jaculatrix TaxID=941984 RepID=UPI001B3AFFE8|nr:uncharacterized protein LOC121200005 [Toxotes jaculatrix]
MDPRAGSDEEAHGRPRRERRPPGYLRDYQTQLYSQALAQDGAACPSPPEAVLLKQELAQLKGIVAELRHRLDHYEQSVSGGDEFEEQSGDESCEGACVQQDKTSNPETHDPYTYKSQSEPALSESVQKPRHERISQSVQTLQCQGRHERPLQPVTTQLTTTGDNITQPEIKETEGPYHRSVAQELPLTLPELPLSTSVMPSAYTITGQWTSGSKYSRQAAQTHAPPSFPASSQVLHSVPYSTQVSVAQQQQIQVPRSHVYPTTLPPTCALQSQPSLPLVHYTQAPPVSVQHTPIPLQAEYRHFTHTAHMQPHVYSSQSAYPPQSQLSQPAPAPPSQLVPMHQHQLTLPPAPALLNDRPRYSSRIEVPSFPNFTQEDPHEFAMLKMALNNLLPPDEPELYKYHILLDHLHLSSARHIALSYAHDPRPYTMALAALEQQYERTIVLPSAAEYLGLDGAAEKLDLRTPQILIGTDNPHLITPIEPVRLPFGLKKAPVAVNTKLGWALQGPTNLPGLQNSPQCLFISIMSPYAELKRDVEKLWQADILPYRNEKLITRSKQDREAMELLETKTIRINVDGIEHYATPLLRAKNAPKLQAPKESVMPLLRSAERQLQKKPELVEIYNKEAKY